MIKSGNALGLVNQSFPIWEKGACLYWRSRNPEIVQEKGGVGKVTFALSDGAGAQGSPYLGWDPGKCHYKRMLHSSIEMPKSGFFSPARTNYFDTSEQNSRGFTYQTGLTQTNPAIPDDHILDPVSHSAIYTTACQIENISGTSKFCYQSNATGLTGTKGFGVLIRNTDGSAITANVLSLVICAENPNTVWPQPNLATDTTYRKIRDDGWHEVVCKTASATTTLYFCILLHTGHTIQIEVPTIESISSSTIDCVVFPNTTASSTNRSRKVFQISVQRHDDTDVGLEGFPESGWIGLTLVCPFDASTFTYPSGTALRQASWESDSSNYIQLRSYTTNENEAASMYSDGVSQVFLNIASGAFEFGQELGIVLSWGKLRNSQYCHLFINGHYIDIDTNFTMPTGVPTVIKIGFKESYDTPAGLWVQEVAVGRNYLNRSESRPLSVWFKNRAIHSFESTETADNTIVGHDTLSDGLIGYWGLDNTPNDSGPNALHGTLVNSPSVSPGMQPPPSTNGCYTFNGLNQSITVPYNAAMNPSVFTVAAWFYTGDITRLYQTMVSRDYYQAPTSREFWSLSLYTTFNPNQLYFAVANTAGNEFTAKGTTPTNYVWCHATGIFDGSNVILYRNGIFSQSVSFSGTLANAYTDDLYIGRRGGTSFPGYFYGGVDEIIYADRVFSEQEILDLYNYGFGRRYS